MLYGLRRQRRQAVRRPVKKMAKKAKKALKKLPYQVNFCLFSTVNMSYLYF